MLNEIGLGGRNTAGTAKELHYQYNTALELVKE